MEPKSSSPYGRCPCCAQELAAPLSPTVPMAEYARRTGLTEEQVRAGIRRGMLPGVALNPRTLAVPRPAVERFIAGIPPGETALAVVAPATPAVTVEVVYRDPARGWGEAAP